MRGELYEYLNLGAKCSQHNTICTGCAGARILLQVKPVHGEIARRISDNITAVPIASGLT